MPLLMVPGYGSWLWFLLSEIQKVARTSLCSSSRSAVLICVFHRPSAPCWDIQTELPVISPPHLWLPHESGLIGGRGSPGRRAARIPALRTQRPVSATAAPPVPAGTSAFRLPMTNDVGWFSFEVRRRGGVVPEEPEPGAAGSAHYGRHRRGQREAGRRRR